MSELEGRLPGVLGELSRDAPHNEDLARRVRAGLRRRRIATFGPVAAVLAVLVVLAGVWVSRPSAAGPVTEPSSACAPLQTGPLPDWARAGFSSPDGNPFQLSAGGSIAAVVFANPLVAPPAQDQANKILWVARDTPVGTDTLRIDGTLEGGDMTHSVNLGAAPGPSYVDMPAPGCWQLTLTWGTHTDTINLRWDSGATG
ncbi:MAG: hypothetical protein ABJD68_06550 [Nakamurella sp.]